jgi:hypothetical protein
MTDAAAFDLGDYLAVAGRERIKFDFLHGLARLGHDPSVGSFRHRSKTLSSPLILTEMIVRPAFN